MALAFSGDGATSTGDFHEGLNIASVLRLPLVIVIENNQWAFGTPTRLQHALPTLALRALAYGRTVEGHVVDGTNVLTVFDTVRRALRRARRRTGHQHHRGGVDASSKGIRSPTRSRHTFQPSSLRSGTKRIRSPRFGRGSSQLIS